ncbi:uncharacterized protein LOC144056525 [Vanacampus margaritifer]
MPRRRCLNPKKEAMLYIDTGRDKHGLDVKYISEFKGRGVFACASFEKGDFLLEYRGALLSKQECERRQRLYHDKMKAFMFEFRFDGRTWCVDAATEDGSLGRLVNDDHINPNSTMKYLNVQGKPHLCLFATRDIDTGEEITYNYGDSDWPWRSKESGQQNTSTSKLTIEETTSTAPTDARKPFQEHSDAEKSAQPSGVEQSMMETRHSSMSLSQNSSQKHSDAERSAQTSDVENVEQCMMETRHSSMSLSQGDLISAFEPQTSSQKHSDAERSTQPSEVENIEQSMMETRHSSMSLSQNDLSPPHNSSQKHSDTKRSAQPLEVEDIEQYMMETSDSTLTLCQGDLSPELEPQTSSQKDCWKHLLEVSTLSAFDKCVLCLGPISSFTWTGYRCKACSRVWHLSCYRRKQGDDEILDSDEEQNSGSEYVPDSDDDSDSSMTLVPNQSKVRQREGIPALPTNNSNSLDTHFPNEAGTSKCLPTDVIAGETSDSEISSKDSSNKHVKNKDKKSLEHLNLTNRNYCFVCGKPQSRLTRHLKVHMSHPEVAYAFYLPDHSQERKTLFEKMRNRGNFQHNTAILQGENGQLKVKRRPKSTAVAGNFVHCMHCQGLYVRKDLWRHVRRCPLRPENCNLDKQAGRARVLCLATAQDTVFSQHFSSGMWKVLSTMKTDEIGLAVRNDLSIVHLAQSLYNKHGQDPTKYEHIRQKLREVGRLLVCLRANFSVHSLEEAIKPSNFQTVVQAVKQVAGFDEESLSYHTPSLALKLGHTLNKICDIIHCRALMAEDATLVKETETFRKLYTSKWCELISHKALSTLSSAKYNKPPTLPFTEDVQVLHQYLQKTADSAVSNLVEEATPKNYAELAKLTLAQIIVFNRRRAGEVSKMLSKGFNERDSTKLHKDVALGLSQLEQRLCNYFTRVELVGKRERKVVVLLAPSTVEALSLLTNKRKECGVPDENIFLFGRPKTLTYYRGCDCLRIYASLCGAKQPELLRSTQLRKHVATLTQILNLKKNELDQVADFLGHDIRVHRDFYRLPVPTMQLAKISKLLLSIEKGELSGLQGKSLDEIEIEDNLSFSENENNDGSDSEGSDTEVGGPLCEDGKDLDPASDSTILEQEQNSGGHDKLSHVTSTVGDTVPSTGVLSGKDDADQESEGRRQPKKMWSKAEVAAVMRHFGSHIKKGKLASKVECSQCKRAEDPVLSQRTVQNIRDFVRNRITTAKRQAQKRR